MNADTGTNMVVIRDGCEYIRSEAFAGMDIWEMVVESDEMVIDPDAFNQDFVYVIANRDSSAAAYAEAHGWAVGEGRIMNNGDSWYIHKN